MGSSLLDKVCTNQNSSYPPVRIAHPVFRAFPLPSPSDCRPRRRSLGPPITGYSQGTRRPLCYRAHLLPPLLPWRPDLPPLPTYQSLRLAITRLSKTCNLNLRPSFRHLLSLLLSPPPLGAFPPFFPPRPFPARFAGPQINHPPPTRRQKLSLPGTPLPANFFPFFAQSLGADAAVPPSAVSSFFPSTLHSLSPS